MPHLQQSINSDVDPAGPLVAIVAGEPSGDRLGAGLIGALSSRYPTLRFSGIGGPKMRAAGCEIHYDMDRIGVMGLDGLREKLFDILSIRRGLGRRWVEEQPAVFVGVDVPDFNLALEVRLRAAGVPCVHYVSPTVWAWRGYRIHRIRRAVSHMLALFPFEATYYQRHDVPVTCVGHPVADEIDVPDRCAARKQLGLSVPENGKLIALLPGSRASEIRALAQSIVAAARALATHNPALCFVLPFANDRVRTLFYQEVGDVTGLPLTCLDGDSRLAMEAADLGIVASGTASLEAALLRLPHVAVYRLSKVSYRIMRWLRQVDHYAMPNHLLDSPELPELIQDDATAENMAAAIQDFIDQPAKAESLRTRFAEIHASLKRDADQRAADVVAGYLHVA